MAQRVCRRLQRIAPPLRLFGRRRRRRASRTPSLPPRRPRRRSPSRTAADPCCAPARRVSASRSRIATRGSRDVSVSCSVSRRSAPSSAVVASSFAVVRQPLQHQRRGPQQLIVRAGLQRRRSLAAQPPRSSCARARRAPAFRTLGSRIGRQRERRAFVCQADGRSGRGRAHLPYRVLQRAGQLAERASSGFTRASAVSARDGRCQSADFFRLRQLVRPFHERGRPPSSRFAHVGGQHVHRAHRDDRRRILEARDDRFAIAASRSPGATAA